MEKQYTFNRNHVLKAVLIYFLLSVIFYYAANERICYIENLSGVEGHDGYTIELFDGTVITQHLNFNIDYVEEIGISVATFMRNNTGNVIISLEDERGKLLAEKKIKADSVQDNSVEELSVKKSVGDGIYTLKIISDGGKKDASITIYRNSKVNYLGQGYVVNDVTYDGSLEINVKGGIKREFSNWYWIIVVVLGSTLPEN